MASNDVEILDPAVPVEKVNESKSGYELDRRHFFTALGVAGVAAGAALVSSKSAFAQQPTPNGFAQVDVLNLMINIKYLKATLYSFITKGTDLPASSFVTVGTGGVFNAPKQITFTNPQITDLFNEMYYDELNQLIALRALLGVAVVPRQTINFLATGNIVASGSGSTPNTITYTQPQAIALARLLEDLSATAFTTAAVYLTGANLNFATQALATDGLHAGAIRLIFIQNNVQYQGSQFASVATSNTAQSPVSFVGSITAGSNVINAFFPTNPPAVGTLVTGIGIPPGAGAQIIAVTATPNVTPTAIATKGSNILTLVSNVSTVVPGQPITGTNVPASSYITAVGTNTITFSNPTAATASGSTTVAPTGFVTLGSPLITGVSSLSGLIIGQSLTAAAGIPPNAVIAPNGLDTNANTILMSANATANSLFTFTGVLKAGDPTITSASSVSGIILGQNIFGVGIPPNTTIKSATSNTVTMTANATVTTSASANPNTFTGIVTNGSPIITLVSSVAGLAVGQLIAGAGIPNAATIKTIGTTTVTMSANATASSTVQPTGNVTSGSTTITGLSSVAGLISGQSIAGTGIPSNTTITSIGASALTITISAAPTQSNTGLTLTGATPETVFAGGQSITSNSIETITSPTTQTYTIGQTQITIAGAANLTGVNTYFIVVPDTQDVVPGDPGTAALSASGPSAIPKTSPAIYQGFFNTAGTGTSGSTNTPPGFAFARSFQQILAVLYGYNATNSIISTANFQGGFYPNGVSGQINSTI